MVLCVVDATGIQDYIFGSNRLQENLGASFLVAQATGSWVKECLPRPHNLTSDGQVDPDRRLEADEKQKSELLYSGGGNAVVLLRDDSTARAFAGALSRKVLSEAPGLELAIYFEEVEFAGLNATVMSRVQEGLAAWKQRRPRSQPLLALPVVATCSSTRGPATAERALPGADQAQHRLVSAEVAAKLDHTEAANQDLRDVVPPGDGWGYPYAFDNLGRSEGSSSYLTVLHADGNGIGQRVRQISGTGRDYLDNLRAFSDTLDGIGRTALNATVDAVRQWLEGKSATAQELRDNLERNANNKPDNKRTLRELIGGRPLPLRPIVYGGDDVTLVCDGRLGLAVATRLLDEFGKAAASAELPGGSATASAGLAVVKTHYPFAQAYGLAVALTSSAKAYGNDLVPGGQTAIAPACLDWHFAQSGLAGSLQEIRRREYEVALGQPATTYRLHQRPATLGSQGNTLRHWATIEGVLAQFTRPDGGWVGRQNKLLALREALRGGPDAVKAFLGRYGLDGLPAIAGVLGPAASGYGGTQCAYFDAIEAMDFWVDLNDKGARNGSDTRD